MNDAQPSERADIAIALRRAFLLGQTFDGYSQFFALVDETLAALSAPASSGASEAVAWTTGIDWEPRQTEQVKKLTRMAQPEHGFTQPLYARPPAETVPIAPLPAPQPAMTFNKWEPEANQGKGAWVGYVYASVFYKVRDELEAVRKVLANKVLASGHEPPFLTPPAEAVRQPLTCIWTKQFDGPFDTSCGNAFQFTDDAIEENNFKFCCYCGGAIETDNITGTQE